MVGNAHEYEPTPEEIRDECEKIQSTWTPEEKRRRRGKREFAPYEIPTVVVSGRGGDRRK